VKVSSEDELAEVVRGARGPFRIRGGGTRDIGRPVAGEALEASGLSGITLYEPGALTLVAGAGTPLVEVEAVLAAEGQRLAFEPADWRGLLGTAGEPTLGGMVAANVSGPRRVQAGAARDALLGVRFVDGAGRVVKNGGRVMKNVTGYDLVKLMAGSRGALGVLTEVSLKVQAIPETEATLVAGGLAAGPGLALLRAALKTPYDISGAAMAGGAAMIRVEGLAGSVAYRAGRLQAVLGGDWQMVEGADSAALWRDLRDVAAFAGRPGAVWRLVVKPTEAARIAAEAGGEAVFDRGGGLIWLLTDAGADVRGAVGDAGHATLVRPLPGMTAPLLPPEAPAVAALTIGLRRQFDPRGIFTQGAA
jgi:glycolate oxidase FAD binding subunit